MSDLTTGEQAARLIEWVASGERGVVPDDLAHYSPDELGQVWDAATELKTAISQRFTTTRTESE